MGKNKALAPQSGHSEIGASSMHRWAACPGSVRLSRDVPKVTNKYAEEGTEAHELAAKRLLSGAYPPDCDPEMQEAVDIYVRFVESTKKTREALIEHAFDLSNVHPGLYGTCDMVVFDDAKKLLTVGDYKHGAGVPVDVERNPQLLYYGLGAVLSTGFECEEIELVIVQPRCNHPDGPIRRWSCSAMDLLDFALELKAYAEATEDPFAKLVPGEHCRFCPAKALCPAIEKMAQEVAKSEFPVVGEEAKLYKPKDLSAMLERLPILETWIEGIRAFAYAEAEAGRPPPGWKLVAKRATRKWKNEAETRHFLDANYQPTTVRDFYDPASLKSPTQVEKVLHEKQYEKIAHLIEARSSGNTLVHENDPRPAVKRADAKTEFDELDLLG